MNAVEEFGSEVGDDITSSSDLVVTPTLPLLDLLYEFARDDGVLLTETNGKRIAVAVRDDTDPASLLEVGRYLAMPLDVKLANDSEYEKLLSEHYPLDRSGAKSLSSTDNRLDGVAGDISGLEDRLNGDNGALVTRLIKAIIAEAARQRASDIHIEPDETGLVIKFRVDGVLYEKLRMPPDIATATIDRVKLMAQLDLTENHIPQDGKINLSLGKKIRDLRVSTLPSGSIERVAMQILDKDDTASSLELLGISDEAEHILKEALAQPSGLILVAGPKGSGKTTTLYAGLKQLIDGYRNIQTLEDPIEYAIEGVGQTQIDHALGLSCAIGLRAILRQDPDVVMIGEIRDKETADITVQAALAGHLMLSTVCTNDAVGAIAQLRDMKVDPFQLASTVRTIVAQRLVRKLCAHCREPIQAEGSLASLLGFDRGTVVFREKGCKHCDQTGFQGRIGVFEAIRIDDTIRKIINDGADESRIASIAFLNNKSLASSARNMVRKGLTTAEEGIRISRLEEIGAI